MGIIPISAGILLLGNSAWQGSSGQAFGAIFLIVAGLILQNSSKIERWFGAIIRDM